MIIIIVTITLYNKKAIKKSRFIIHDLICYNSVYNYVFVIDLITILQNVQDL